MLVNKRQKSFLKFNSLIVNFANKNICSDRKVKRVKTSSNFYRGSHCSSSSLSLNSYKLLSSYWKKSRKKAKRSYLKLSLLIVFSLNSFLNIFKLSSCEISNHFKFRFQPERMWIIGIVASVATKLYLYQFRGF